MDANESLNNFDYEGFMTREFSYSKSKFPDITRLLGHFDKITKLLLECGIQSLKVAKNHQGVSAYHANTRYTIVCNFRLRTINLIKIFNDLVDIKGGEIFDEGTANIIARSLLESYLVYFRLYNGCKGDKEIQNLYFNLYDLSSAMHFLKYGKSFQGIKPEKFDEGTFNLRIKELIKDIKSSNKFGALPQKTRNAIQKIEAGEQDYINFINFNKLIRESPLPTNFVTTYYSYASSFAHSEGFSSSVSQTYFQSRERWKELNQSLKFKLIYMCLAVSSQFYISFIEYDKTQMANEKEQDVWETLSLCNYYLTALNINK
ncbi:hypothetical protein [Pedobacter suwonensis]|uniref:hypothetical protein n=1 Tax=Pedobacter suwonensis TaxID=332999 RepID=UPI0011A9FECA|nr:hypothetical protein [Pedobacter suwonensis]